METDLKDKVRDYIQDHGMISEGDIVCVAVSGGADSMCLLFLLHELSSEMGFELSAVHVEHGIRGAASLEDMAYVDEQCKKIGVKLETVRVDAPRAAEKDGTSLEEAARDLRYKAFEEMEADRIALAHHMNDRAETVLFNLIRGTGMKGLRGMEPQRGRYIRPLLCATRQEAEEYCRNKDIRFRHDSTNDDLLISRNRIRHKVLSELSEINEGAVQHINEAAEEASATEEYLAGKTGEAYGICVKRSEKEPSDIEIDIKELRKTPELLASRVIRRALAEVSGREKDISRKHVRAVLELMSNQSGRQADLLYGIRARRSFGKIVIACPGRYELPDREPVLKTALMNREEVSDEDLITGDNYTKFADYATIGNASALSIRHRRPGDFISIKDGNKKLKDLLIEEKIPKEKRDGMYFLALGQEIVWIFDTGRIGERFKVKQDTEKVLRMEIENG